MLEIEMSSHISSRREYVLAKLAIRNLRRTIRDLRERLIVETNPIDYYCALADAATAEAQLDDFCVQIGEWELRGACVVPHGRFRGIRS